MKKGFTLLELIIVVIIIGILATLGFGQYTRVMEKGRKAEALSILGTVRSAEAAYYLEHGIYGTYSDLYLDAPTACVTSYYFSYTAASATGTGTATRCSTGGKTPQGGSVALCTVIATVDGTWSGNCPVRSTLMRKGFTLIEILITIIIVGILAAMSLPPLMKAREGAMDKEAMASLKLIQAAEDSYYLETGVYRIESSSPCQSGVNINTNLGLRLDFINWDYCVGANGADDFNAFAWRQRPTRADSSKHRLLRINRGDSVGCCFDGCADSNTKAC